MIGFGNSTPGAHAFAKFAEAWHQDIFEGIGGVDLEPAIDHALEFLSASERLALRAFLEQTLDRKLSDSEMNGIWRRTTSAIRFTGGGTRQVMQMTLIRLAPPNP